MARSAFRVEVALKMRKILYCFFYLMLLFLDHPGCTKQRQKILLTLHNDPPQKKKIPLSSSFFLLLNFVFMSSLNYSPKSQEIVGVRRACRTRHNTPAVLTTLDVQPNQLAESRRGSAQQMASS